MSFPEFDFVPEFDSVDAYLTELTRLEVLQDSLKEQSFKLNTIGEYLQQGKVNKQVASTILSICPDAFDDEYYSLEMFTEADSATMYEVAFNGWSRAMGAVMRMVGNMPVKIAIVLLGLIMYLINRLFKRGGGGKSSSSSGGSGSSNNSTNDTQQTLSNALTDANQSPSSAEIRVPGTPTTELDKLFDGSKPSPVRLSVSYAEALDNLGKLLAKYENAPIPPKLDTFLKDAGKILGEKASANYKEMLDGMYGGKLDLSSEQIIETISALTIKYTEVLTTANILKTQSLVYYPNYFAQFEEDVEEIMTQVEQAVQKLGGRVRKKPTLENVKLPQGSNREYKQINLHDIRDLRIELEDRLGSQTAFDIIPEFPFTETSIKSILSSMAQNSLVANFYKGFTNDQKKALVVLDTINRNLRDAGHSYSNSNKYNDAPGYSDSLKDFQEFTERVVNTDNNLPLPLRDGTPSIYRYMFPDGISKSTDLRASIRKNINYTAIQINERVRRARGSGAVNSFNDYASLIPPVFPGVRIGNNNTAINVITSAFSGSSKDWRKLQLFTAEQERTAVELFQAVNKARSHLSKLTDNGRVWLTDPDTGVFREIKSSDPMWSVFYATDLESEPERKSSPNRLLAYRSPATNKFVINRVLMLQRIQNEAELALISRTANSMLYWPLKSLMDGINGYVNYTSNVVDFFLKNGVDLNKEP